MNYRRKLSILDFNVDVRSRYLIRIILTRFTSLDVPTLTLESIRLLRVEKYAKASLTVTVVLVRLSTKVAETNRRVFDLNVLNSSHNKALLEK
jgi:hypothetical protein